MRSLFSVLAAMILASGHQAHAQNPISNLPRELTIIIENPEGSIKNPSGFNIWTTNAGGLSNGTQLLAVFNDARASKWLSERH